MKNLDEKKLKKLGGLFALDAGLALFMSLFFSNVMAGEGITLNPIRLLAYIFKHGFPGDMFLLLFVIFALLIVYNIMQDSKGLKEDDRNFLYSKGGTYGTAQLLQTPDDISEVARVEDAAHAVGTIFGQLDLSGDKIIDWDQFNRKNHRNKHVCVFGASSSGKTHCYVKPFCIQAVRRGESVVITDPKDELYEDTAAYFRDNGYVVRRLDLKNLSLSDGWDLLAEVRGDPDRAAILADVMWSNLGARDGSVFDKGPATLLKAMLLRVGLDDKYKAQKAQNIKSVYDMVQNPEGEAYLDKQFNVEQMDEKTRVSNKAYMAFKQGSDNLRGSLLTNLSAKMEVFQSDLVCRVLSTPDIDTTLPGKVKCAYFCMLPDMYSTYNFIGALFFSFLFLDLVDYADRQEGRRCKIPVNFLLDEFANIGSIPEFDKKLATVRSRALYINIILQDLPQLMNRYPQTYGSILSNCATLLCIGCNDPETAKYLSTRSGETTTQVRTDQHSGNDPLFADPKHSTGEGKRSIFTVDELMRFNMDECLIIWQAMNPLKAYKFPFDSHPDAVRMHRTDVMDYPRIDDEEGRKKLREEEEARIADYNKRVAEGWDPFSHFGAIHYDSKGNPIGEKLINLKNTNGFAGKLKALLEKGKSAAKELKSKADEAEKKAKKDALEDLRISEETRTDVELDDIPVIDKHFESSIESFRITTEAAVKDESFNSAENPAELAEEPAVKQPEEPAAKQPEESLWVKPDMSAPPEPAPEPKKEDPKPVKPEPTPVKEPESEPVVEEAGDEPTDDEIATYTTFKPGDDAKGFDDDDEDSAEEDSKDIVDDNIAEVVVLNEEELKDRVFRYKNLVSKRKILRDSTLLNEAIRKVMFGSQWDTVDVEDASPTPSSADIDDFLLGAQNPRSQLSSRKR